MPNPERGLFIVNKLQSLGEKPQRAYCRIQAAAIYTVTKPARHRLVSYKVIYWDEQPRSAEDCTGFKTFTCPKSKQIVFTVNKNFAQVTSEELEMFCIKHFLEVVLIDYTVRRLKDALAQIQTKKDEVHYAIGANVQARLGIWSLLHTQRLESIDGNELLPSSSIITYRGNLFNDELQPTRNWVYGENDFLTFDHYYEGYGKLNIAAVKHFDDLSIIAACDDRLTVKKTG